MVKVTPLTDDKREVFTELFKDYYAELGCGDDAAELADEYVIPDLLAGLLHVELIYEESAVGFIIWQIDDIDNEWCFREGWGDVREIYISPSYRRRGLGKFLLYTAELKLKESGAAKSYCLPAQGSENFFAACGYSKTDEYDDDFGCFVHEKLDLENCGCKK